MTATGLNELIGHEFFKDIAVWDSEPSEFAETTSRVETRIGDDIPVIWTLFRASEFNDIAFSDS